MFLLLRHSSFALPVLSPLWLGTSYTFFNQTNSLLTETAYIAFSLASLLLFELWRKRRGFILLIPPVIACWAAIMTRSIGITLALALAAALFLNEGKSKKSAGLSLVMLAACVLPFIGWAVRNIAVGEIASNYFSQFFTLGPHSGKEGALTLITFFERVLRNAEWYFIHLTDVVGLYMRFLNPLATWLTSVVMFLLLLTGIYARIRSTPTSIEYYSVFYVGMILTWPFLGARFLLCIFPILLAYIIHGAWFAIKHIPKRMPKAATAVFVLLLFLVMAAINSVYNYYLHAQIKIQENAKVQIIPNEPFYTVAINSSYKHLLNSCFWLIRNAESVDIIMARKPRLVALATRNPTIGVPESIPLNPEHWLKEREVKYIILDEAYDDSARFIEALKKYSINPDKYRIFSQGGGTFIVKVLD